MEHNFQAILPELKNRIQKDFVREIVEDTDDLTGVPYPYVTPGSSKKDALYYWDSYFINLGLIRLKLVDLARHNVENLIYLQRKLGYIPCSNLKQKTWRPVLPILPWFVRDIYRATGDKDWLTRMLPAVIEEFQFWTTKPHTSPVGLFRYVQPEKSINGDGDKFQSLRFNAIENFNPVDLNAMLYRNAILIYDLQTEAEGKGDKNLLQKSEHIKKMFNVFLDSESGFYFDNNFAEKGLSKAKTLAGFMPLFVEMLDEKHAELLQKNLKEFIAPGGVRMTDKNYETDDTESLYPLVTAPHVYFLVKGLIDHDFMEDAADIGENWLAMVQRDYKKTGEMWEWYNVSDKSSNTAKQVENLSVLGSTAGAYIALIDALGLA
jgi:alpha,alpha-trehalase